MCFFDFADNTAIYKMIYRTCSAQWIDDHVVVKCVRGVNDARSAITCSCSESREVVFFFIGKKVIKTECMP